MEFRIRCPRSLLFVREEICGSLGVGSRSGGSALRPAGANVGDVRQGVDVSWHVRAAQFPAATRAGPIWCHAFSPGHE